MTVVFEKKPEVYIRYHAIEAESYILNQLLREKAKELLTLGVVRLGCNLEIQQDDSDALAELKRWMLLLTREGWASVSRTQEGIRIIPSERTRLLFP